MWINVWLWIELPNFAKWHRRIVGVFLVAIVICDPTRHRRRLASEIIPLRKEGKLFLEKESYPPAVNNLSCALVVRLKNQLFQEG